MRNDPIREAIAQLNAKPGDAARIDFYRHLADGLLLVAVAEVGGRTVTAEGRIVDEKGKRYAHATTTCIIFRPDE
jgi:acyl-coenzyme A thioesterase PaaI-like protein